jgi:hypothetical protein
VNDGHGFAAQGEFPGALAQQSGLEDVLGIGVGSGDDIGDTVLGGGAEHGEGVLEGGGAVVQPPDEMSVYVDHAFSRIPTVRR